MVSIDPCARRDNLPPWWTLRAVVIAWRAARCCLVWKRLATHALCRIGQPGGRFKIAQRGPQNYVRWISHPRA